MRRQWSFLVAILGLGGWAFPTQAQDAVWQDLLSGESGGPRIRGSFSLFDRVNVPSQDAGFRYTKQEVAFSTPVWGTEHDEVSVFGHLRLFQTDTQVVLPDTGEKFPEDLWGIQSGVGYRHRYEGGQILSVRLSVGSASDEPFATSKEMEVGGMGFVRLPAGERDSWLFFLVFSNNRSYLNYVPLPGVAYAWRPSDEFQATVGIPFLFAQWRPVDRVSVSVSLAPVHNVRLAASWTPVENLRIEAEGQWTTQGWLRADRPEDEDRLYYDEKRVLAGLRWQVGETVAISLGGGYGFGRKWSEGESLLDDDAFNEFSIGGGAFASLGVTLSLGRTEKARPPR